MYVQAQMNQGEVHNSCHVRLFRPMLGKEVLYRKLSNLSNHKHPLHERTPLKALSLSRRRFNYFLRSRRSILFVLANLPRPHHPQTNRSADVHPAREEDSTGIAPSVERDDLEADGFGDC